MDSNDVQKIGQTLIQLRPTLSRLDAIVRAAKSGSLDFQGVAITLTASQRNNLRSAAASVLDRIDVAADALVTQTGLTGTPDAEAVAIVTANPSLEVLLAKTEPPAQNVLQYVQTLQLEVQVDGSWSAAIPAQDAQQMANMMATVRDCLKAVTAFLRAL